MLHCTHHIMVVIKSHEIYRKCEAKYEISPSQVTHPMCIIGPSGPTGSPAPTANVHDINLTINDRRLRT